MATIDKTGLHQQNIMKTVSDLVNFLSFKFIYLFSFKHFHSYMFSSPLEKESLTKGLLLGLDTSKSNEDSFEDSC